MMKDPVCGMNVSDDASDLSVWESRTYSFCSALCKELFERNPENYVDEVQAPAVTRETHRRVAYFSMEIGVDTTIPCYSGGLGVLAGDTLRSCADLDVPIVAVTLLQRSGYFHQQLDGQGNQNESPVVWSPGKDLELLPERVQVEIEGRQVSVGAWRYDVGGANRRFVPVLFLDTDFPENSVSDRRLTGQLYGGDDRYRLSQEVLLGIGGVRLLRALGYTELERFHLNEGHSALLILELLRETRRASGDWDFKKVRRSCVFTTHTPVPAGHDRFSCPLVQEVLGDSFPLELIKMLGGDSALNMTFLALDASDHVNGVAKRHGQVSREMFPGYLQRSQVSLLLRSVRNGVRR